MAEELDELAGVEAFAPRDPGDPDDPFAIAFAEPRRSRSSAGGATKLVRTGLLVAVIVFLVGALSIVLGLPDDGDDDDVDTDEGVASLEQTTSSSPSSTAPASTSTTAALTTGTGTATSTTAPGTTLTTLRTSTTLVTTTSTTDLVNRGLVIELDLSDDEPAVDQPVTLFIRMSDPDAIPTGNCQVIKIDGEELFPDDPCDDGCDVDGSDAEPTGGTRELSVAHTFTDVGIFTIEVTGHSGEPECNNPFHSVATESFPVTVGPAS